MENNIVKFKGKFQETLSRSFPGRTYSTELFERLINEEKEKKDSAQTTKENESKESPDLQKL
jgi:hypothetical protein